MRPDVSPIGRKRNPIIEEARRRQIIDAAIEAVASVGVMHASLARIAQTAGISKSVISYHFNGRNDLLEQVVSQIYTDSWAFLEPRLAAEPTAAGKLRAYLDGNIAYMRGHRSRLLAVSAIVLDLRTEDGTPRFSPHGDDSVVELLAGIVRAGRRAGEFRDADPRVVAVTVNQAVVGILGAWVADPALDLAAAAIELGTLFDHALKR